MIKLFMTGDNHFGKKYDRYPEVKDKLIQSRFDVLSDMVDKAETEQCGLFVVTGDLFDNNNTIRKDDVKKVVDILAKFSGSVILLPGNHDYYNTGAEKLWRDFEDAMSNVSHNITLIKEFKPYEFDVGEDKVVIYPAFCDSKHSRENKLGWIKQASIDSNVINIGVAHGAIQGVTPDMKQEYFLMTEAELNAIPVDAWLIGHTHIPYPDSLSADKDTEGYKIFNAGTHEQTDLHNNTEGNGFILTIDKSGSVAKVLARKYVSGKVRFYDLSVSVSPDSDDALKNAISDALQGIGSNSILRLRISGSVKQAEYLDKANIYRSLLSGFLTYETEDSELSEQITKEKIQSEFAETSFASKFMEELLDSPTELQMAYELLQECKE